MIPKFRCFVGNKKMFEVEAIDFTEKEVQIPVYDKDTGDYLASTSFNFDDIILMQSTGLFDRNGVEIFEGDFIVLDELTYVVKQGIHKFSRFEGVGFYLLIDMGDIYIVDPMVTDGNRLEVIGNIHEHPELVEGRDGMD